MSAGLAIAGRASTRSLRHRQRINFHPAHEPNSRADRIATCLLVTGGTMHCAVAGSRPADTSTAHSRRVEPHENCSPQERTAASTCGLCRQVLGLRLTVRRLTSDVCRISTSGRRLYERRRKAGCRRACPPRQSMKTSVQSQVLRGAPEFSLALHLALGLQLQEMRQHIAFGGATQAWMHL